MIIKRQMSGFTLLEVLISIVILSIGLLGMAGLVAMGIKNNHTASYRSHATFLADDILDRIRANNAAALAGDYGLSIGGACKAGVNAIAMADCAEWKGMVEDSLPGGSGAVALGINRDITITIQWTSGLDENQDGTVNAADLSSFVTVSRL